MNSNRNVFVVSSLVAGLALASSPATAADNLAAKVASAKQAGTATWISWTEKSAVDAEACCWNSRNRGSRACTLGGTNYNMNFSDDNDAVHSDELVIYAHVDGGEVDRVRVFSGSCPVDRSGENVIDVTNVSAPESVGYLSTLIQGTDGSRAERSAKRRSDGALGAIAMHDDHSADTALEKFARDGETKQIRHTSAFWLGNARDKAGYDALVRLRSVDDASFREQLTFAFTQSKVKEAPSTLIDMAKNDPSPKVRGQALFWIAQKAQKKSDAEVIRAAVDDPDVDVKKKAVFALSQIPNGEGVPELIRVAQENKTREVRKQAMFWLGQSKDPRALAFFEKILAQ